MKIDIPKTLFATALILFGMGFFMLCDCPGWFAISAVLSACAIPKGTRRIRLCSTILCVAATIVAFIQISK